MMTTLEPDLQRLGDLLEHAMRADLASASSAQPASRRRRRISRRTGLALIGAAVLAPAAAVAASGLITSPGDVARSLPAGTLSLAGTEPTCTVVDDGVEYSCTLAHAPAPEVQDWKGTVEPTVDATKHVNGGCRSLASDGRTWQCYLGQAAVEQEIVGAGLLGEFASSPAAG